VGTRHEYSPYGVDSQIAVQKQNGETTSYSYDPAGRTEKTVSEGPTNATVVNHYAGPGEAITWTEEEEGKHWTREIPGIDGTLAATQHNSEPAVLQLHDLQGNIVATAATSETETKLLSSYNPTEYGVPVNGTPPTKYSWLGAGGFSTEQSSGAANPGGGSYIPQLGAPLQTQPVAAPGAFGDGVSGTGIVLATYTVGGLLKKVAVEHEATLNAAAAQEATEKAKLAAEPNSATQVNGPGEGNCEANCEVGEDEGDGDDPWEVLTGEQAATDAKAYYLESLAFSADAVACQEAGQAACAAKDATLAEFYGLGSEKLEGCYNAVHNGRQLAGHDYENEVCWVSWELTKGGLPTKLDIESCWAGNRYGFGEWDCGIHGWHKLRKIL
jgi:YD repeat-containing protein